MRLQGFFSPSEYIFFSRINKDVGEEHIDFAENTRGAQVIVALNIGAYPFATPLINQTRLKGFSP